MLSNPIPDSTVLEATYELTNRHDSDNKSTSYLRLRLRWRAMRAMRASTSASRSLWCVQMHTDIAMTSVWLTMLAIVFAMATRQDDALLTERLDEAHLLSESASVDTQQLVLSDTKPNAYDGSLATEPTVAMQQQQQFHGWSTERSVSLDTTHAATDSTTSLRHAAPAQQQRRRKLSKEQQQIQSLTRQLSQSKKLIADLRQQLHVFYKNEAVAQVRSSIVSACHSFSSPLTLASLYTQLENTNRAKQLEIDALQHENRTLQHQQRLLTKQIDELQDAKARPHECALVS